MNLKKGAKKKKEETTPFLNYVKISFLEPKLTVMRNKETSARTMLVSHDETRRCERVHAPKHFMSHVTMHTNAPKKGHV